MRSNRNLSFCNLRIKPRDVGPCQNSTRPALRAGLIMTTSAPSPSLSVFIPEGLNLFNLNKEQRGKCEPDGNDAKKYKLVVTLTSLSRLERGGFLSLTESITRLIPMKEEFSLKKSNNTFSVEITEPSASTVIKIIGALADLGRDLFNATNDNFTLNGYKHCSASVVLQEQV